MQNARICDAYKALYDTRENEGNPLKGHNNPGLLERWGKNPGALETQIMCHKMGTPISGTKMYECDGEVFGPARWPYEAGTTPNHNNPPIKYIIRDRLKAIGSTWWDWKNSRTIGLGFDFDSIMGHAKGVGISDIELEKISNIDLPWIEIIRSTQGAGRHLYIWFKEPYPVTMNHFEHAAVARSFIPMIAEHTGLNIEADVDCCGSVLWFHHRNATKENEGYSLIKPATQILTADYVPPNWRDHLEVVSGGRSKVRVQGWTSDGVQTKGDELDSMTQAYSNTPLEETHLKILEDLEGTGHSSLWVHDHHLWQGHTAGLKYVFDDWKDKGHAMKGVFDTNSLGDDPGKPNCFMRPKSGGAWDVYRFGTGVVECDLWDQQGQWTHIVYNHPATLRQICMACGGFESPDSKQGFIFSLPDELKAALELLESKLELPRGLGDERQLSLRERDDLKVILVIQKKRGDKPVDFTGYANTTKGWERVLHDTIEVAGIDEEALLNELDDKLRALKIIQGGEVFDSWVLKDSSTKWVTHPRENVKAFLSSIGHTKPDQVLGQAIFRPWTVINRPFQSEYPGARLWNRNSIQFAYEPIELEEGQAPIHPNWDRVMNHCGLDLNSYIPELPWASDWGIRCGGDYLKAWIACMFKEPECRLPYLFMYGAQNCGKSTFHEVITMLLADKKGVERADRALTNAQGFNGELEGVILAIVDEIDISGSGLDAYNKLKDWTTGLTFPLHPKGKQVVNITNLLHFVQMSNSRSSLPVFSGDSRITAMNVPCLDEDVPKEKLMGMLREEAPAFMRTLMDIEMLPPIGRFRLPVIETQGKLDAMESNMDELERFIEDRCFKVPGTITKVSDFVESFYSTVDKLQQDIFTVIKIKRRLSDSGLPIGRGAGNVAAIGNLSLVECSADIPFVLKGKRLAREEQ